MEKIKIVFLCVLSKKLAIEYNVPRAYEGRGLETEIFNIRYT